VDNLVAGVAAGGLAVATSVIRFDLVAADPVTYDGRLVV
jgi:hypothetical protein